MRMKIYKPWICKKESGGCLAGPLLSTRLAAQCLRIWGIHIRERTLSGFGANVIEVKSIVNYFRVSLETSVI